MGFLLASVLSGGGGGGGRVSPPPPRRSSRHHIANGGSMSRDKVCRIGFLSIVLVIYSGITVGLVLWNQSGASRRSSLGGPAETPSEAAWLDDSRQDGRAPGRAPNGRGEQPSFSWREEHRRRSDEEGEARGGTFGDGQRDGREQGHAPREGRRGGGMDAGRGGEEKRADIVPPDHSDATVKSGDHGLRAGAGVRQGGGVTLHTSPPMEEPFDVTLVSQTSRNRFWMLPFLCKRWPGPISIAILEEDRMELPDELCSRMMISSTKARNPEELDPVWYPVNRLRNVAVRAVTTSHFLMTDIDIWPDVNAYQALHMRYRLETERLEDARNAIVFSAFSRRRFCEEEDCLLYANDVPETISDLKPCLETNTCGRFDAANQSGQGTAYVYYWRSMLRQPNQRTLEHILCFKSHRFEPYLVVRKSAILPLFDERFMGYGKNKIQWINHLRYSGFSFYVMPVNFVIHAPHPKSVAKTVWEKTGGGKQGKGNKIMDQTFETFMKELREEKGGEESTVTGLCQKSLTPQNKQA